MTHLLVPAACRCCRRQCLLYLTVTLTQLHLQLQHTRLLMLCEGKRVGERERGRQEEWGNMWAGCDRIQGTKDVGVGGRVITYIT